MKKIFKYSVSVIVVSFILFFTVVDWELDPRSRTHFERYTIKERIEIDAQPAVYKNWLTLKHANRDGLSAICVVLFVAFRLKLFQFLLIVFLISLSAWFLYRRNNKIQIISI